ncbi:hypothetical protein ACTHTY_11585, partial [Neisseria sp. P0019.S002]
MLGVGFVVVCGCVGLGGFFGWFGCVGFLGWCVGWGFGVGVLVCFGWVVFGFVCWGVVVGCVVVFVVGVCGCVVCFGGCGGGGAVLEVMSDEPRNKFLVCDGDLGRVIGYIESHTLLTLFLREKDVRLTDKRVLREALF